MKRRVDLTGRRFGRLVVLRFIKNKNASAHWRCLCDCGNKHAASSGNLLSGRIVSCGCKQQENRIRQGKLNKIHGHSTLPRSRTYRSWLAMNCRCNNPTDRDFYRYGGCGIKICKRWQRFENFLADMGERPVGKTLDRYPDPHGNYKPSNCRWATPREQALNRRKRKST
jgi:hypothetical protein